MNLEEFVKVYDHMGIDFDGAYGYQCMDLFHYYEIDVLGIDQSKLVRAATAYKAYLKGADHFDRFQYKPGMIPKPGDIMFWNTSVGPYGHVAVFIDGSSKDFVSFDQNWPPGSKCKKVKHTYKGVAGWLRYNQLTKEDMKQLEDHEKALSSIFKRLDKLEELKGETKLVKQVKKNKKLKFGKTAVDKWFKKKKKKKTTKKKKK